MKNTNNVSSKTAFKISSGRRINHAADDSAGLGISERMKAQIRSLDQCQLNIQDGISLVQTAEGGLAQIENPNLQRLKELAVKAANGDLSSEDREKIQMEIDQIKGGINDIANNTEFNGIELLNGTNPNASASGTFNPSTFDYANVLKLPTPNGSGRLDLSTSNGYPTTTADDNQILDFGHGGTSWPSVVIGGTNYYLTRSTGNPSGTNIQVTSDSIQGNAYVTTYKITNSTNNIDVDVVQSINIVKDKYNIQYSIKNNSSSTQNIGFQFNLDTDTAMDDGAKFQVGSTDITTEKLYANGDVPDKFKVYNRDGASNQVEVEGIIKGDGIIEAPSKFGIGQYANGIEKDNWTPASTAISDSDYSLWWNERPIESNGMFTVNTMYGLTVPPTIDDPTTSTEQNGPYDITLQVGPKCGDEFKIQLSDARTTALGIDDISVSTREDAVNSIEKIDNAINKVSKERGKFGAYQNALEHLNSNVSNSALNLSGAISTIEDADIAKEVMEMTKDNILQQAQQNMLVQANKMPESILNLMKQFGQN